MKILTIINRALLAKWIWRFVVDNGNLWREVIDVKYGHEWGNWWIRDVKGIHGVGVWKAIMGECNEMKKRCCIQVGNEERTRFWANIWCGELALMVQYPFCLRWQATNLLPLSRAFHGRVQF